MRYTLRLLTLDQLGRAATMICALELERQRSPERLGPWPFEIGLWVGSASTPNRMGEEGDNNPDSARARTQAYKRNPTGRSAPIPIEACPWCGTQFSPQSFTLLRDGQKNDKRPTDLRVNCASRHCEFSERRQPSGLPLVTVDEPIYRRLPCFLIATVDKFANLPWNGQTAGFFGLVERYDERQGFYTAGAGQGARPLPGGLPPPDLIIQDELHLISGPLGTMVGLYEAAMDGLCRHGGRPPAKIVASTATVRRAERQIQALFGRTSVAVFPPPGPDRRDSFFARTVGVGDKPGRLYVGLAAQGRNPRVLLLRTCLSIMSRALAIWSEAGGEARVPNPADPYMTVLGYFNALRELGGSRRIIEDELTSRLKRYGKARRRPGETEKRFANRVIGEPHELTSRRDTSQVAGTKHRLGIPYKQKDWLDFALATNMISVGLDITRLGLLVMMGQPKSASEYIQATSRVGREAALPGLVVTLLNVHKPRDRSYFERFATWHASFYRAVEATSVTPFAPRAVDRGLVGVTVALARLGIDALRPPRGVQAVERERTALRSVVDQLVRRAILCSHGVSRDEEEELGARIQGRVADLLDAWVAVVRDGPPNLEYAAEETGTTAFLHQPLDPHARSLSPMEAKFKAPRSLRDVEPSVPLFVRRPDGREIRDEEAL
jgi:hypothetical protein